eukprot:COSAG06_NODE_6115_length_3104_cov_1.772047_2_plen_41_part_00
MKMDLFVPINGKRRVATVHRSGDTGLFGLDHHTHRGQAAM